MTEEIALVTGAGTGVGRAIAVALGGAGMRVALVGRRVERLKETADAVTAAGGRALCVAGDASDADEMRAALAGVVAAWGDPTILVNNAGVHGGFARITQSDPESWRRSLLTNVYGPYLLCRLCAPAMLRAGRGWMVNVGSASGLAAPHGTGTDYVLTKVTLNYLTRQIAQDLEGTGVVCCVIHPGEVKTEMWQAIRDDAVARGPEGAGAMGWVEMVDQSGGDPPEKAADLVLKILRSPVESVHGKFLWIEGGIQTPREAW